MKYEERLKIADLLSSGRQITEIAKELGKSERTIYYELRLGADPVTGKYNPDVAQETHKERVKNTGGPPILKTNRELAERISHMIKKEHISPQEISKRLKKEGINICTGTIYNSIRAGLISDVTMDTLCCLYGSRVHDGGLIRIPWYVVEQLGINDGDLYKVTEYDADRIVLTKVQKVGVKNGKDSK